MQLCRELHHIRKEIEMGNQYWRIHSMDDIVFEGRNKMYGAFLLRRLYDKHMSRAMIFAMLLIIMVISSPQIIAVIKGFLPEKQEDLMPRIVTLTAPPLIDVVKSTPPPAKSKLLPAKEQIKFVPPVIVKDEEEIESAPDLPTIDDLQKASISSSSAEGVDDGIDASLLATGIANAAVIAVPVEDDTPFMYVEQMPSFPDGTKAMYKFINDGINYPVIARENRIFGQVTVQFVVSKEGEIQNAKVIRGIGGGCDQEALRIINSMPRWKPGMHNGRPVPVTFTMPIKFVLH